MSRILIAAKSSLKISEYRLFMGLKGYQLISRTTVQDAIAFVLEDPPDILILEKNFDNGGDLDLIRAITACLQKTNIPILLILSEQEMHAGLDWNEYPVDDILLLPLSQEILLTRVQLAESRMIRVFDNNPLSKLPGNTSILRAIQKTLDSGGNFAVCYVDIDNFKPFNDHYGFYRGDEVILMVARVIVNVVEEIARQGSFVGHVGGDDFVFIVKADNAELTCKTILANFEAVRNMFINPEDIEAGGYVENDRQGRETRFSLLSLSIAVLPTGHKKFKHFGEVSAAASQIKHHVKQMEGSNYMIDRREGYCPI